jgi:hypothetical protein
MSREARNPEQKLRQTHELNRRTRRAKNEGAFFGGVFRPLFFTPFSGGFSGYFLKR